jgi:hypothetical protein
VTAGRRARCCYRQISRAIALWFFDAALILLAGFMQTPKFVRPRFGKQGESRGSKSSFEAAPGQQ